MSKIIHVRALLKHLRHGHVYIFGLESGNQVAQGSFSSTYALITNLSQMDLPTLLSNAIPFPILGLFSGILFIFPNFNRPFCNQTVDTLIRRRNIRRLIWVYIVCLCPTKRPLGLNGLSWFIRLKGNQCHMAANQVRSKIGI